MYTLLVISFDWYKEWIICLISWNKFSELLSAFTCARAMDNLWSNCLGVNILSTIPPCSVSFCFDLKIDSDLILELSLNKSITFCLES